MRFAPLAHLMVLSACVEPPETSSRSHALSVNLAGAVDVGDAPCPCGLAGTCHYFELYADGMIVPTTGYEIDVVAYCDGKAYADLHHDVACPSNHDDDDTLKITCGPTGCGGGGQINVALAHGTAGWPSNRACYFQLQQTATSGDPDPSYSNRFGPVAPIRIISATNLTVSGSSTKRFDLIGDFPGFTSSGAYVPFVRCDGLSPANQLIEQWSLTSVRLSFTLLGTASRDCVIAVQRNSDSALSTSFHVRIGDLPTPLPARFAGYIWSGHTSPQDTAATTDGVTLTHAVTSVTAAGMRSARLRLGPAMRLADQAAIGGFYENIGLDARDVVAACPANVPFLPCVVQLASFQEAINTLPSGTPSAPVYVPMTVYDSATTGPYFLQAYNLNGGNHIADHADEIVAEYRDLTYALYQTQLGTGRTFIIVNWETENQIGQNGPLPFKHWLYLRQQGIAEGRALATAAGLTAQSAPAPTLPAHVANGIEFSYVRDGQDYVLDHFITGGYPILDPWGALCPEYVSWSSWQGTNAGTLDEDIPAVRARLASTCPGSTLILGELGSGYPQNPNASFTARELWHFLETVRAAYRWNLPVSVLWEAFPTGVPGLLNADGSDKDEMRSLRTDINNYAAPGVAVLPPQPLQIHGIRDRGITSSGSTQRNFELYGSFPNLGTYVARYRCDGGSETTATITMQPTNGQMNIRIVNPTFPTSGEKARFCTFWVVSGTTRSPEVGPRGLCPVTGPMNPAPYAPCP